MRICVSAFCAFMFVGGVAEAGRRSASVSSSTASYSVVPRGHCEYVVRTQLPSAPHDRLKVLKAAMTDEILGRGNFQNGGDTPAFELISHGVPMRQTKEVDEYTQGARYEIDQAHLSAGSMQATLLLPVSGHVGRAEAKRYRRTNQYNLVLNGSTLAKVAANDYVTELPVTLSLQPGRNLIEFWPDGSGGVGGFQGGREIEIDVK